jgi:5'-nucleotidase
VPDRAATDAMPAVVDQRLVVAISSRTLFDLDDSHAVFQASGVDAYRDYQVAREDEPLAPGVAFPLVRKLLALNQRAGRSLVEVILLSRNSSDTGLRVFNSIQHYGLDIVRAAFTGGAPPYTYIRPFQADLFLSADGQDVRRALRAGIAAATILPSAAGGDPDGPLRIAFDGDAVVFGDESERISVEQGVEAFARHETEHAGRALSGGPFRGFLAALHALQAQLPADDPPIRTALVTARSAPAHKRVILTLRAWGVRLDEAIFLGGRAKGPFLEAFAADIFFDDSGSNTESARQFVATGHVPHGVANPES